MLPAATNITALHLNRMSRKLSSMSGDCRPAAATLWPHQMQPLKATLMPYNVVPCAISERAT